MLQLSPVLFWDVDQVDIDRDIEFVTGRVIEYGTLGDFKGIIAYYGYETVKGILLNNTRLSARDLHFCSVYFNIDKSQFACYTKKSSTVRPLRFWNP